MMNRTFRRPRPGRRPLGTALAVVLATLVGAIPAACSADSKPTPGLSGTAAKGETVARDRGCMSCHGSNGQGGVGPKWRGLAGSEVELKDSTTVVADDEYLRKAITDPEAQEVKGYSVTMPKASLTSTEVDQIVAYIKELAE